MNTKVLLTKDKKTNSEVYLLACDEGDSNGVGSIKVIFPDMTYDLYDRDILYIADRAFLVLNACKGTRINVTYPLTLSEELIVRDFLSYWGNKRLQELKQAKWLGFLGYWKHVIEFVEKNVDVGRLKPTYETYYVDNRDYGGSESVYFNIRMSYGNNWHHDFDKTRKLNNLLMSEQIDRSLDGLDEEYWFSKIHINFRPLAEDIEDFVEFDYKEKL